MNELITSLLLWIATQTGYDTSNVQYSVEIISHEQLQRLYFLDTVPPSEVGALYDPYQNTIYLSEYFSQNDLYETSLLLHELVHVVQDANSLLEKDREIYRLADQEAYRLQALWLKQKGLLTESLLTELVGMHQTYDGDYE